MPGPRRKRKKTWSGRLRERTRSARYFVGEWLIRGVGALCRWAPHRLVLGVGRALGQVGYRLAGRERAVARRNLAMALGDRFDPRQRDRLVRRSFESLGMMLLEAIHVLGWSPQDWKDKIRIVDPQHLAAVRDAKPGIVFLSAHIGNWELVTGVAEHIMGVRLNIVVRSHRNPRMNALLREFRSGRVEGIYDENDPPLAFVRLLKRGKPVALLVDQDTKRLRGAFVDFFGHPAWTPVGPAVLARMTGSPMLFAFVTRGANPLDLQLRFHPPVWPDPKAEEEADTVRLLRAYHAALELEILERPEQWVWVHDRWKTQKAGPTNPEQSA